MTSDHCCDLAEAQLHMCGPIAADIPWNTDVPGLKVRAPFHLQILLIFHLAV